MTKQAATIDPGAGERIELGASVITIKVSSEQTGGELAVVEYDVPGGFAGPPLHIHPSFDEVFQVLSGELFFRLGEEVIRGVPGTVVYVPGDQPHTFSNPSDRRATMVFTVSPGGFEGFFREMAAAAGGAMPAPEVAAKLNEKYGAKPVG
jgi:quercetin dioxygenase-like cupin family protein